MRKVVVVVMVFLFLAGCASTKPSNPPVASQFDGTWVGDSERINGPNLVEGNSKESVKIRLEIKGNQSIVSIMHSNEWVPFWSKAHPVSFYVFPNDTNAVIFQTNSARDSNCLWVETWSFNLTKTSADTANAYFYRTVNNRECKFEDDGIWSSAGSIRLVRSK